jgi:hypothetical protein
VRVDDVHLPGVGGLLGLVQADPLAAEVQLADRRPVLVAFLLLALADEKQRRAVAVALDHLPDSLGVLGVGALGQVDDLGLVGLALEALDDLGLGEALVVGRRDLEQQDQVGLLGEVHRREVGVDQRVGRRAEGQKHAAQHRRQGLPAHVHGSFQVPGCRERLPVPGILALAGTFATGCRRDGWPGVCHSACAEA